MQTLKSLSHWRFLGCFIKSPLGGFTYSKNDSFKVVGGILR
ncbi:hypothetical protein ACR9ML_05890 [Helicobacter pylori]